MSASKHDWGLIFAGVALAAAGFFCMLAPGLTIVTIAAVVGAFFLVAGVFDIISYIRLRNIMPRSGWELAYAIIDVLLGLIFLLHPLAFSAVVPWLVGVCFVAFGVFEVIASVKAHGWGVPRWGWALFSGVLNVLCGIAFFVTPQMLSVFLAIILLVRVGAAARFIYCMVRLAAAEEQAAQYKKRARNTVIFYVIAESIWQIKDLILYYYS